MAISGSLVYERTREPLQEAFVDGISVTPKPNGEADVDLEALDGSAAEAAQHASALAALLVRQPRQHIH